MIVLACDSKFKTFEPACASVACFGETIERYKEYTPRRGRRAAVSLEQARSVAADLRRDRQRRFSQQTSPVFGSPSATAIRHSRTVETRPRRRQRLRLKVATDSPARNGLARSEVARLGGNRRRGRIDVELMAQQPRRQVAAATGRPAHEWSNGQQRRRGAGDLGKDLPGLKITQGWSGQNITATILAALGGCQNTGGDVAHIAIAVAAEGAKSPQPRAICNNIRPLEGFQSQGPII